MSMPSKFISGNLYDKVKKEPKTKGWFIGHFIKKGSIFHTNDFEVKWGVGKKGEFKKGLSSKKSAKTIGILIRGKVSMRFPETKEEVIMSKTGDYVIYDAHEVNHEIEALKDSTIITIRWPSKR